MDSWRSAPFSTGGTVASNETFSRSFKLVGKPAPRKVCCGGASLKLPASALNKGMLQKSTVVLSLWAEAYQHGPPPLRSPFL